MVELRVLYGKGTWLVSRHKMADLFPVTIDIWGQLKISPFSENVSSVIGMQVRTHIHHLPAGLVS